MDHLAYYNLKDEPFSIMPLTNFYYHNEQHDQAMLRLVRAVDGMMGLAVLVGDIGTGKTLLARRLLESLPDEKYEVSLLVVLHADVTSEWLVKRIASQFGINTEGAEKVDLIGKLYERLVQISEEGRRAIILIDEAHMLRQKETLEEIRGLLNLELPEAKLLSFVMFGMPELDTCLSHDSALKQRIAVRYRLKNFSSEILFDYINFRLKHAGAEQQIFSADAYEEIYKLSNGNPRLVNVICDNSLFEGFIRKAELPLEAEVIKSVGEDLGLPEEVPSEEATERR
ncbi:MAG: AAA family ATPase [Deltaproteobacteria bacterium]|jgi:general secretion pathway protein A|nr:AAA family ATPase [Deltaproteobacteria bacterium]